MIDESLVRKHLVEMGFEPDALSKDAMAEFISELRDLDDNGRLDWESEGADDGKDEPIDESIDSASSEPQDIQHSYQHLYQSFDESANYSRVEASEEDEYSRSLEGGNDDYKLEMNQKIPSTVSDLSDEELDRVLDRLNFDEFRREASYQKLMSQETRQRALIPRKYKKNDPVSMYHAHQLRWTKDRFLQRLVSKPRPREASRFGGVAIAVHERPIL